MCDLYKPEEQGHQEVGAHPRTLNQNLLFKKIPRWFTYTSNFEQPMLENLTSPEVEFRDIHTLIPLSFSYPSLLSPHT